MKSYSNKILYIAFVFILKKLHFKENFLLNLLCVDTVSTINKFRPLQKYRAYRSLELSSFSCAIYTGPV